MANPIPIMSMTERQLLELQLAIQMCPRPRPPKGWRYWAKVWALNIAILAFFLSLGR